MTNPTPTHSPVPKAFAELAQTGGWHHIDYERTRVGHLEDDLKSSTTCVYSLSDDADSKLIAEVLGSWFMQNTDVNQHAMHSLRLALWETQKAFAEHEKRMAQLRRTAQGRTYFTQNSLTAVSN